MQIIGTAVVMLFVVAVLAVVGYALFELSPYARHADRYRDPTTGKRIGEPPRLD